MSIKCIPVFEGTRASSTVAQAKRRLSSVSPLGPVSTYFWSSINSESLKFSRPVGIRLLLQKGDWVIFVCVAKYSQNIFPAWPYIVFVSNEFRSPVGRIKPEFAGLSERQNTIGLIKLTFSENVNHKRCK